MNAPAGKLEPTLIGALAKALPELEGAKKNKKNPAFKSSYADLGAVIDAIQPIAQHGLWYRQQSHESADGVMVETFYIHTSGEELSAGTLFMPATKKDAQGFGSALSYARRYALQLAFGLATEDDDGNSASSSYRTARAGHGAGGDNPEAQRAGPAEPATDRQGGMPDAEFAKIVQLIEATGTDTRKMLRHYGVSNLRQLNQDAYAEAVEHLNARLATMAKEQSNAKARTAPDDIMADDIRF
jgi:hypothetical protein